MGIWTVKTNDYDYRKKYSLAIGEQIGKIILPSPKLLFNDETINEHLKLKRELNHMIEHYVQTTRIKSPCFNLSNFFHNMNTSSIIILNNYNSLSRAIYYLKDNRIVFRNKTDLETFYHELYHLSTRYISPDGTIYAGFSQIRPDGSSFAINITEGYNSLLTNRNFGKDTTYPIEAYFMSIVEYIVGKDFMEKNYSEMNLLALVEEIKKHGFLEDFMQATKSIDSVFVATNSPTPINQTNLTKEYIKIYMAIINLHIKIIKSRINLGYLNSKEAEADLSAQAAVQNQVFSFGLFERNVTNFITPEFINKINVYMWSNLNFQRMK